MSLFREYHKLENGQEIKFVVSFNRETRNWATGGSMKIGYTVNATPIQRSQGDGYTVESFGAFTGFNDTLIEIERQSAKRLQTAIETLKQRQEKYLDYFRVQQGLLSAEEYTTRYKK